MQSTELTDPPAACAPGQSLAQRTAADGTRFILATFVDMTGKPCSKLVPVSAVGMLERDGVGFAGYAAGLLGQRPCDPDVMAVPDLETYTPLPTLRDGMAMVHCDPHVEGSPWAYAPRVILRAVMDKLAAAGMTAKVGGEAEYFLVRRGSGGVIDVADPLDLSDKPCYDARDLTRMYEHLTELSDIVNGLGWSNYANDHEDGNGQFEQNFWHADPMTTADRLVTFRYLTHVVAERRGMTATFMPKPFTGRTGTGMHLHLSLWDGEVPLFPATGGDPRGLGLAPVAYQFIAGLLEHAPALQAVLGPTVNSYKRTAAATTTSGATWAPKVVTYGGNDRTTMLRVPEGNRVEVRSCDGSANPYLALAALLAAGLDGIERGLDPGEPGGSTGPRIPQTLLHAADALAEDEVVRSALDICAKGSEVSEYFVEAKRNEFLAWHGQVSQAEVDQYLTAF